MENSFNALLVSQEDNQFSARVQAVPMAQLPANDTLIRVQYSSLNYKDALSASGNKGVTRTYPHIPGIDAAGVVVHSESGAWNEGDTVIVTGFDLGMNTWGGLGQYIRVPAHWAIACPEGLSAREAMAFGTAGLTAGLCIDKLLQAGVKPGDGPVAVSGATGGVGSLSLAILAQLGFETVAITGKPDHNHYLMETLGVSQVVDRNEFIDTSPKAILPPRFKAAIDSVGGSVLSTLLRSMHYNGVVAACGMAQAPDLTMTVFPFILKGVSLLGVDSVLCPMEVRKTIWHKLATDWNVSALTDLVTEVSLEAVPAVLATMRAGQAQGRTIVNLD